MDRTENTTCNNNFIVVGVFTDTFPRNGLYKTVVLLLHAYLLGAFPSNGHCLQIIA
jgi:hypothetical protein